MAEPACTAFNTTGSLLLLPVSRSLGFPLDQVTAAQPDGGDPALIPRGSMVLPVRSGGDFCDDAHILVYSQLSVD